MTWLTQQGTFELSDLILQSGARLPSARLSWKAHGTLAAPATTSSSIPPAMARSIRTWNG